MTRTSSPELPSSSERPSTPPEGPPTRAPSVFFRRFAELLPQPLLAVGITVGTLGAVGFLPLFGGPGYEASLAAGLILPALTIVSVTLEDEVREATAAVALGLRRGLLLGAVGYLVTALHGLRAGFCAVGEGTAMFVLGPLAGALLAGAVGGAWLAVRSRGFVSRRAALALGLLAPLGTAVTALHFGFYTPIVFAFDPFVGFFSGTLYDTVIDSVPRLSTYRVGTVLTLLAIWCAARIADGDRSLLRFLALAWAGGGSLVMAGSGSRFDHWHTATTIRRELGGFRAGKRCDVVHPTTLSPAAVDVLVRDCDTQLAEVAEVLGVKEPERVVAYFFTNPAEKRRLMGAADTYIAKPWRREVYLQLSGYPHPILGHELAHVLAGRFAKAPLHVAGSLRGFLPDPGLIEGMAVAASPDDDELSPEEWCRAMLELGILPPLSSVFSLGFLGQASSRAYTVAGAFVTFVRNAYGKEAVARWYGGADLVVVTGESWSTLEARFRKRLEGEPLSPAVRAIAKARFDRPAIFGRICPHVLDAEKKDAMSRLALGDATRAQAGLFSVLARDPHDGSAELGLATCAERLSAVDAARERLERLAKSGTLPAPITLRAEERLGDLAYAAGQDEAARAHYDAVLTRTLDEDARRTLDVKKHGLAEPRARRAIGALLVGRPPDGTDSLLAFEELGRWSAVSPGDGLPLYLLARNALSRGDYRRGGELLDRALRAEIALPSVVREAARQRSVAACAVGDEAAIVDGLARFDATEVRRSNRGARLHALANRCLGR